MKGDHYLPDLPIFFTVRRWIILFENVCYYQERPLANIFCDWHKITRSGPNHTDSFDVRVRLTRKASLMIFIQRATLLLVLTCCSVVWAGPLSDRFNNIPPEQRGEFIDDARPSPSSWVSSLTLEQAGCAWGCRNYHVTINARGSITFVGKPEDASLMQFAESSANDKEGLYVGAGDRRKVAFLFQYIENTKFYDLSANYLSFATDQYTTYLSVDRKNHASLIVEYGRSAPIEVQLVKNLIYEIIQNADYKFSDGEKPYDSP